MQRSDTILLVVLAALLCSTLPSAAQQPREDHFKVYITDPPITLNFLVPIQIADQFGTLDLGTFMLDKFSTPVEKQHAGVVTPIEDPVRHYSWWRSPVTQPRRDIVVTNQFGQATWATEDFEYLLLPAIKNNNGSELPDRNHYACYRAVGPELNLTVGLTDQFGNTTAVVMQPEIFCNPAEKTLASGEVFPIRDGEAHLACYRINPQNYQITYVFRDQFGDWGGNVLIDQCLLCVPSEKEIPVPAESSSWGGMKTRYE